MASGRRPEHGSLQGLAFPFALLAAGLLFAGRVNSFSGRPELSYLLPPLAPLGLWASGASKAAPSADDRPAGAEPGRTRRKMLATILVALPLAIALGLAVSAGSG